MWAVLTGQTDWVCHIGTLTLCIEAVAQSCIIVTWWSGSGGIQALSLTTKWFPSVLWHCWFGHLACKDRLQNDLLCVEWDVKPYTFTHTQLVFSRHCTPDVIVKRVQIWRAWGQSFFILNLELSAYSLSCTTHAICVIVLAVEIFLVLSGMSW